MRNKYLDLSVGAAVKKFGLALAVFVMTFCVVYTIKNAGGTYAAEQSATIIFDDLGSLKSELICDTLGNCSAGAKTYVSTYEIGSLPSYTAKKSGYVFNGWSKSDTSCDDGRYYPGGAFNVAVGETVTLYPCFNFINIQLNLDGGTAYYNNNWVNNITINTGRETGLDVVPRKPGYSFDYWEFNGNKVDETLSSPFNGIYGLYGSNNGNTVEVKAKYTTERLALFFDKTEGEWVNYSGDDKIIYISQLAAGEYRFDSNELEKIKVKRDDYTFVGWKRSSDGKILTEYLNQDESGLILSAVWERETTGDNTTLPDEPSTGGDTSSTKQCYYCVNNNKTIWASEQPAKNSNGCTGSSETYGNEWNTAPSIKSESACSNMQPVYKCYRCVNDDKMLWSMGKPSNNSNGCTGSSEPYGNAWREMIGETNEASCLAYKPSSGGNDNQDDDKQEITESPDTGSWMLYILYLIGILSLGYTGYYSYKIVKFKKD